MNLLSASLEFAEQLARIEDFLMDVAQHKDALAIIKIITGFYIFKINVKINRMGSPQL